MWRSAIELVATLVRTGAIVSAVERQELRDLLKATGVARRMVGRLDDPTSAVHGPVPRPFRTAMRTAWRSMLPGLRSLRRHE